MNPWPDLRTLVPHAGAMCLLERIEHCTESEIECATSTHRSPANPLRRDGRLAALHLAEYGAQAMAVHGGLRNPAAAGRGGMLVAIRDLALSVERLDDLAGDLSIRALQLVANPNGQIYSFTATCGGRRVGSGRVSVMTG